jgi:hypothetical protein
MSVELERTTFMTKAWFRIRNRRKMRDGLSVIHLGDLRLDHHSLWILLSFAVDPERDLPASRAGVQEKVTDAEQD